MKKVLTFFAAFVGVIILLIFFVIGDATDWSFVMGSPEMGNKFDELNEKARLDKNRQKIFSASDITDTVKLYAIDSAHLFFPDTFLTIRINQRPFIMLLDSEGNALEKSVCNAHFPGFQKKVIHELVSMEISEDLTSTYNEYLKHLLNVKLEPTIFQAKKKYTIIMGFEAGTYSAERNIYFQSVIPYLTDEIDFYLIAKDNYTELNFPLDLRNERFVRWAYSEGEEFSDSTLAKYGLRVD